MAFLSSNSVSLLALRRERTIFLSKLFNPVLVLCVCLPALKEEGKTESPLITLGTADAAFWLAIFICRAQRSVFVEKRILLKWQWSL